jgi:hypothetical protein
MDSHENLVVHLVTLVLSKFSENRVLCSFLLLVAYCLLSISYMKTISQLPFVVLTVVLVGFVLKIIAIMVDLES